MFVKICGITNVKDALDAVELGADAVGFLFTESPRKISVSKASEIVKQLPANFLTIGVFRDQVAREVIDTVREVGLLGAQMHGRESVAEVAEVIEHVRMGCKICNCRFARGAQSRRIRYLDDFG